MWFIIPTTIIGALAGGAAALILLQRQKIEKLKTALLPFAINCDFYKPEVPHFEQVQIPMQYLRAARAQFDGPLQSVETVL